MMNGVYFTENNTLLVQMSGIGPKQSGIIYICCSFVYTLTYIAIGTIADKCMLRLSAGQPNATTLTVKEYEAHMRLKATLLF